MKLFKNVFITGGGGFLAPHLVNRLLPTCRVTMHIRHLAKAKMLAPRPDLQIISGAMSVREMLIQLPPNIDAVIHLAGAVQGPA